MVRYPRQEEYQILLGSGLFLADWYRATYGTEFPEASDPLMDFCSRGWQAGRAPNPYFDCAYYVKDNEHVRAAGLNPLLHYLQQGERQGSRPVRYFDPQWYRKAHHMGTDENCLVHFLSRRLTGRASPTPDFEPIPYLRTHPHLVDLGIDPFLHWQAAPDAPQPDERAVIEASGLFDATFYLLGNPDVREARQDPLAHFIAYGARENRNPNLYFDVRFYAGQPGAASRTDMNPVMRYFLYGEVHGERPGPHFDPIWYAETYAVEPWRSALGHYLANRRSQRFSPNPGFDVVAYMAKHRASVGDNRDPFAHYMRHAR
jgi:hypothetical protein